MLLEIKRLGTGHFNVTFEPGGGWRGAAEEQRFEEGVRRPLPDIANPACMWTYAAESKSFVTEESTLRGSMLGDFFTCPANRGHRHSLFQMKIVRPEGRDDEIGAWEMQCGDYRVCVAND